MRFDTSMQQRMSMKQILAPRMIQSMEILQLASMDLAEHIEQEWEENPVLGIHDGDKDGAAEDAPVEVEEVHEEKREVDNEFEEYAEDWDDDRAEFRSSRSQAGIDDEGERKQDAMQNMVSRPQSLQDYLIEQLQFQELDPATEALVEHLISNLRDNGFLPDLESVMLNFPVPVSKPDLDAAVRILQQMEPTGIGARDLRECLLLQLDHDTPHRDVVRNLILNHFDDVTHNRLPLIQKKTGLDHETIHEAIEILKKLNPNPGSGFDTASIPYVTPDVKVELTETGEFVVKVVDDYLPDVYIKRSWLERVKKKDIDPKERDYLRKKIQSAQWLIEAIQQRRNTLKLVTQAIVEHQRPFLEKKVEHINPLKMQQIADQVGRHVTTISRAVDEKWVETPRGIFPLKRFFGGGTTTTEGEEVAWEQIKSKLNELIGNEDKSNPLSDEELVDKLQESNFPVARRTVTKYRKLMNIPSSRQRKEWAD
jgi:RNA polymerase sigma-54 factor